MKNYVYALFNNLSNRYDTIMSFPSDAMAIARLQEGKISTSEYTLCRVGFYDIENGVIVPETAPVRLVWSPTADPLPTMEAE